MDPIKILAPISLALVGLSTALFLNVFVLGSPTLEEDLFSLFKLPEIRLPNLSSLLPAPKRNPRSNFSTLIDDSPTPTSIPNPDGSAPPRTSTPSSPAPINPTPLPNPFDWGNLFKPKTTATPSPAAELPFPDALEITDAQINSLIAQLIPANTPVRDVQVKFGMGKILISGRLLSPIEGNFTAEAAVNLEDGLPNLKITKASLGSLPIPTFFLGSVESLANTAIRNALSAQNIVKIKKLEITEGKIRFAVSLN